MSLGDCVGLASHEGKLDALCWGTVNAPGAGRCIASSNPAPGVKMGDPQTVHMPLPGSGTAPRLPCYPTVSRGINIKADMAQLLYSLQSTIHLYSLIMPQNKSL